MNPASGASVPVTASRVVVDAACVPAAATPALDARSFDAHQRCAVTSVPALHACHNVTFGADVRVGHTADGKVTVTVITAPPTPGWSFLGQLHAPATNVRMLAPSVDACNGTYTFAFDVACQADGVYHASVWPSFCRFYDGMDVVPETCGGRVGRDVELSTADVVTSFDQVTSRRLYRLDGVEIVVARDRPKIHMHRRHAPHRARTPDHLPVCAPERVGDGVWLASVAVDHGPRSTLREPCAPDADIYAWSPNGCRMRWFTCAQAYEALAAAGATDVAFVGDSRTNHVHRILTEHLASCADGAPPTGTTVPHTRDFKTTFGGRAFRLRLLEPFGSSDAIDEMRACPAVAPVAAFINTYAPAKAGMGSVRSHLMAMLTSDTPPPTAIVIASGGLHDMLAMTHTEAYFDAGVQSAIALLKAHYNGTVLFHSMPAAHGLMYPFQSYVKQYARGARAMAAYARAGYRYVDLFPASFGLRSRYFDRSHFYPEPGYGTPVAAYPKTMGCTLAQLLVNGLVGAMKRG